MHTKFFLVMIYSGKRCTVCTQLLCKVYSTLLNFLWFTHAPQDFFLHMVDSLFIITIWSTAVLEKNVREKIGIWFEVMNMKVSKYIRDFEFSLKFSPPFSLQIFIVWGLRRLKRSLHFWDYPNILSVRLFWKMLERNQLIQLNV